MAFHSVFIGIDKYQSPDVNELSFARRDAKALQALFADTLGGETRLLADETATRAAIEAEFSRLANCAPEDTVVITFSGHGSETHELVTYDADVHRLAETGIPLDNLTEWFARIPAHQVVFILDCCFSGGMGAKVLQTENRPRNLASVSSKLDQMAGTGRLILTASDATEAAWENAKFGHGFLTHYLLEALQGAEEVRDGDRISVYRLLDYVTRRVIAAASAIGEPQHPTLRGVIDGELLWPVFVPGAHYFAAFPERGTKPVTNDLNSLLEYGFPGGLIAAWAQSIPGLNPLQIDAVNEYGVLKGEHLLVSAPTSSGKTMIGELAALRGVLDRKRALFLLPLKALVSDKHRQFQKTYGEYGVRTIRATGDSSDDIPALLRGQYDICLMTYEKFTALALGSPHILNEIGTVVVDEVQMIADESRGVNLEFILTLLRMRRRMGIEPQLIALSAVIGDTNGLEGWLGGRLLRREERPVPLDEGVLRGDGTLRFIRSETGQEETSPRYITPEYRKNSSQDYIIPLVRKLVGEGKQVIVFRETKGNARGCAGYLARELGLPPAQDALNQLPPGDPSLATGKLREALAGGVAFHISDLDREERRVVEEQFRAKDSPIRVIAATTTLAMGVNTPAEAVVVAGLMHPQDKPYSVAEYKNIVGRAGRLGYADRGQSFLLALTPHEEQEAWRQYVLAKPEDVISRFLAQGTDPRLLIVRVLSAVRKRDGAGMDADEIADFLEASFGAYQLARTSAHWTWNRGRITDSISELAQHGLIAAIDDGGYILTELGRLAGEGGVEVRSILRLVAAFQAVSPQEINAPTLIAAAQLTIELDDVYFPMNKKSTQKEPGAWFSHLQNQRVAAGVQRALGQNIAESHWQTLRAKKAVACLLWMTDYSMERIEEVLTQFGGRPDGAAGPIRGVTGRTYDVLPVTIRVAELTHPSFDFTLSRAQLLARLEVGVPSAASDLAIYAGTRLTRGDYHSLLRAGLVNMEALRDASDADILRALPGDAQKAAIVREAADAYWVAQAKASLLDVEFPLYEE